MDPNTPRPILPRNLTARSAYPVSGNPMTARLESGVGNAHPGLEFDVRVLDRHFLPGLVFDFQFGAGAKLVAIRPSENPNLPPLKEDDLSQGVFLLMVKARFGDCPLDEKVVPLANRDGYLVLRDIIDLEKGERTAVIGKLPGSNAEREKLKEIEEKLTKGEKLLPIERDGRDKLLYAVVTGTRTSFLTEDGVIDPELVPPGELTQNLCSPWQWDFADCYCYYWASSKPDIVVGITGQAQVLNFQRDRTAREPESPPHTPAEWMADNITEAEMVTNWESLPIVTSDREGVVPRTLKWPLIEPEQALLSFDKIADALPDLAKLEHALCVEYLFAKYSILAPTGKPPREGSNPWRRYQAVQEVFSIAVDEMRHFRWVNEMLRMLDRPPVLGRANVIGRDQPRKFRLRRLTPEVLDQFIAIEAPSSTFNADPQQLDGLYTRILVSLHYMNTSSDEEQGMQRRLQQLIKTIIDEGNNHWERFLRIKARLAGDKPGTYLRRLEEDLEIPPHPPWNAVQKLCDDYYELLLNALFFTFSLGRNSRGEWLYLSRQAMSALDNTAFFLADAGYGVKFALPEWLQEKVPVLSSVEESKLQYRQHWQEIKSAPSVIDRLFEHVAKDLAELRGQRVSRVRRFAEDHLKRMEKMKREIHQMFDKNALRT